MPDAMMEEIARDCFAQKSDERVVDWCCENVRLPARETDYPGQFSPRLTPYISDPLEYWKPGACTNLTLVCGTQVMKTLYLMMGMMWTLFNRNIRATWAMDTIDNARVFSEERWIPMVMECERLRCMLPSNSDLFKKTEQHLGGSYLRFVGSNSPGNLSSLPSDIQVGDEVDKWPRETRNEADAVYQLEQRGKSKASSLFVKASSPTRKDGLIWSDYLVGTQDRYFVPCPRCGFMQTFEQERLRWSPLAKVGGQWNYQDVMRTAFMECEGCNKEIFEKDKTAINRAGKYRSTNPNPLPGHVSIHLSSFYSPWPRTSFGSLAVEYLKAKAAWKLKGYRNYYEGLPDLEEEEQLESGRLSSRREHLEGIPDGVLLTTFSVDVQDDRLEWSLEGWGAGFENWTLEHVVFDGCPARPDVWRDLREHMYAPRPVQWRCGMIDGGGHYTQETYAFVKQVQLRNVYVYKGSSSEDGVGVIQRVSRVGKWKVKQAMVHTGTAKEQIFAWMRITEKGPGYRHFSDKLDDEFFDQLTAEVRETYIFRGKKVTRWKKIRPRNEALDLTVMNYAAICMLPINILETLARQKGQQAGKTSEEKAVKRRSKRPQAGMGWGTGGIPGNRLF